MNSLVVAAYDLVALTMVLFLVYVVRQVLNDMHLRRTDSPTIHGQRRFSYMSMAAYLSLTVLFQDYWLVDPSTVATGAVVIGLLLGAAWILSVVSTAMRSRVPPGAVANGYHAPVASKRRPF